MTTKKNNRILVCIDFHEQSLTALHQCYDLARFIKAEIVLLYVIESTDFFSGFFSSNLEKVKFEVEDRLKKLVVEECADSGINFSYEIEVGKVHERILYKAKELKARFIIMGKNGSNQGFRKFLGSNAIKVISESICPVISIKGRYSIGYKNIVLPLNLNKSTQEKVASAISFGKFFGSHIHVVTVHSSGIILPQSKVYNRLKRVQRTLENNGITCTNKLFKRTKKNDHEHILDYANEINADLIMVMTHTEGRFRDYYIGGFAHRIINESDIPVLSIIPSTSVGPDETPVESMIDPFNLF
jgi:nucleotide-binding universal stress UspA family protein